MKYLLVLVQLLFIVSCNISFAQESIQLALVSDKVSYQLNEPVFIDVKMNTIDFENLKGKNLIVTYFDEGKSNTSKSFNHSIKKQDSRIKIDGQKEAKVLRINLALDQASKKWDKSLGIVVDEENIMTSVSKPDDFESFWKREISSLTGVLLDQKMIHAPHLSSDISDVYYIDYQVDKGGSRFYGVLTIPKGAAGTKYPAIVIYPGAGVRSYGGTDSQFANNEIITLQVGVHGIPINQPKEVYESLAKGALSGYQYFNLRSTEKYYFNRVIKGSIRALDFLATLEQFDGKNIIANGSSQGGALSLIVTSLDKRIKAAAVYCPALCQTNGSIHRQAAGWPKPLIEADLNADYSRNWENTIAYYDVVNFSRNINVPIFMTFGMIDDVTPATTVFAAYNKIQSEKKHYLKADVAHANETSQIKLVNEYILKKIR